MEITLTGKIILYADIAIFALFCLIILYWQINVLRGKAMSNPDGSTDDWHEQKLIYGIAVADIFVAIPVALTGIALIFGGLKIGYYLTGLASFWFLWANVMATVTSLRFERPRITLYWIIVYPFGVFLALIYIVWSIIYFEVIF
ncbi:hypothetical protein CEE37_04280 [candidate division LCP-89 bacterium B3_LCP]|uniref:Uncharacterized protein n=1 Tax=candidate division LCP-89 bacterium B3_LCP TaxID=2012998 RepID=A0A532V3L9_UNCL8|nr:MAG: hypothetical protein CEE37_04280 [candidate division LCP-89 bacterium B3_LCP]